MESVNDKQINYQFKLLSAMAMIAVVAGHCQNAGIGGLFPWLEPYSWAVPLFCFISGYFFKAVPMKQYLKFVWRKFKRLMIPLYIYIVLYGILTAILSLKGFYFPSGIIYPMWYVTPIFFCYIIYQLIVNAFKSLKYNDEITLAILTLLFLLIFWYHKLSLSYFPYNFTVVISQILLLLPFFCLGNIFKNKYEAILNKFSAQKVIIFSLIIRFILFTLERDHTLGYTISVQNDFENKSALIVFLGSVNAIVILYELTKILIDFISPQYYLAIANNTYDIMANHVFGFFVLNTLIAIMSKVIYWVTGGLKALSFDWVSYKSDLFYFYVPFSQFLILYLISGILISLIIISIKKKCKIVMSGVLTKRKQKKHEIGTNNDL